MAIDFCFVVCDVNSEKERLVKFLGFQKIRGDLAIWRQNWLYAIEQKQRKTSNNAQIYYPNILNNFLLPL